MRLTRGWAEAAAFVVLYETYETARSHIHPPAGPSFHHAETIIRWERALGLYQEHRLQRAFIDHKTVMQFWDIYYGTIHFVVPVVALWLLWRRARTRYPEARNVFLLMCYLALVVFAVWPLMPPRYLPDHYGFVDSSVRYGGLGPLNSGKTKDTNPFAAMPSLHIGWSVFSAWVLVRILRRRSLKVLAVVYPLVTLTCIVVTANHWVLDALGGLVAFGAALGVVTAVDRLWRRHRGREERIGAHDGRILGLRGPPGTEDPPVAPRDGVASGLRRRSSGTNLHAR
jgi:hypothetical protein